MFQMIVKLPEATPVPIPAINHSPNIKSYHKPLWIYFS